MVILIVEGTSKIYRKSGNLALIDQEGNKAEVAIPDLELVVIVGERSQITSSAILTLLTQGIPIVFISSRMDTYGVLFDVIQVGTVSIRSTQYKCFDDTYCRLKYAKSIILSKLKGLYNVLKYEYKYHKTISEDDYNYVKYNILGILENVKEVNDIDELRALEARGSKYFWNIAVSFIPEKYEFIGRKPRKGDVINSAIDFLYAVLYGITTKAVVVSGLDPFYGFIHTLKSGRLSLTYDLSEMFKPIVIHSIIQVSRKANLKTFKNSRLLKPKTIEVLMKYLHHRLSKESERAYKRKSIWYLPIREINKFKEALMKQIEYKPYIYNPSS